MNFETAFAHYQAHTATAEETAMVERELEKYRLIEDYLAEQELPELPEDDIVQRAENSLTRKGANP